MAHAHDAPAFDPLDPHGSNHSEGHHGHTIVPWQIQLGVLLALLVLTALTVAVSQGEIWAANAMGITIPNWVNIVGAMLIATVKATLVCAFFMQLRYDKALNTIVFSSCLFCVFLFLFFSMLDLGSRGIINPEKARQIIPGGTGKDLNLTTPEGVLSAGIGPRPTTNGPITEFAFTQYRLDYPSDEAMWAAYYTKQAKAGKHPHRHERDVTNYFAMLGFDHEAAPNSPDRSRPRHGLTPGLFDAVAPAHTPGLHHAPGATHAPPAGDTQAATADADPADADPAEPAQTEADGD